VRIEEELLQLRHQISQEKTSASELAARKYEATARERAKACLKNRHPNKWEFLERGSGGKTFFQKRFPPAASLHRNTEIFLRSLLGWGDLP
jgi:hypothetical protein